MTIRAIIGGAAGQGMDTLANTLARILAKHGYGVHASRDYMSRIRGGHNFSMIRAETSTPWSHTDTCNLLVCLDEQSYDVHLCALEPDGVFVYDPDQFQPSDQTQGVPLRMAALARESGGSIMANTVALGGCLALLDLPTEQAEAFLLEAFSDKEGVGEQNVQALRAGFSSIQRDPIVQDHPNPSTEAHIFLEGNQALGMSAAASGCTFFTAYPMTPATGVMTYLASVQGEGVIVEQAEDEIAAINATLGASYSGARAMTATSGGGFSLMVEGLSLAGMTETPAVIILAMRPGPATGFPTRTDQGDLAFVLGAGHGEFPRAVLSATRLEDAFYRLNKAFELADRFQIPVIFLSDQHFADTARTIPPYDFSALRTDRHLADESVQRPYARYRIGADGCSPRAVPGQLPGEVVLADSDEHDERGFIVEDAATRRAMMDKRMGKHNALRRFMEEPTYEGPESPDTLLVGWGSSYGSLREAREVLTNQGISVGHLHFADIWPLPTEKLDGLLPTAKKTFCVEANYGGQFANLVRQQTGHSFDHNVLRYDGRPFTSAYIVEEVKPHV